MPRATKGQLRKSPQGVGGPRPRDYIPMRIPMAITKPRKKTNTKPENTRWGKAKISASKRKDATIRMLKEKVQGTGGPIADTACTISGGALAGLLEAKYPQIGGKVNSNMVLGSVCVGVGMFATDIPFSRNILCVGRGVLAAWASHLVEEVATNGAQGAMTLVAQ